VVHYLSFEACFSRKNLSSLLKCRELHYLEKRFIEFSL